jgi:hypothetical protein
VEVTRHAPVQPKPQVPAGYSAYNKPVETARAPRDTFGGSGSLPASIVPQAAQRPVYQPTASAAQPVMAQQQAPVAADDGWTRSEPPVTAGHAAGVEYAVHTAATARKLDESSDAWTTKPQQPAVTQNYPQRQAAPVAQQPRGTRHGNSFIPPKPVDPRHAAGAAAADADLFGDAETLTAPKMDMSERQPKKSPSLFERFTLQREKEVTAPAPAAPRAETSPKLSVEDGGKAAEDELDIPAFLRRQAN